MQSQEISAAWRKTYARQSLSDFRIYDLLSAENKVEECQRMHYLQMAMEKAAKAHYWGASGSGLASSKINRSHRVVEKFLPVVVREYWVKTRPNKRMPGYLKKAIKQLCQQVDLLAPAVLGTFLKAVRASVTEVAATGST